MTQAQNKQIKSKRRVSDHGEVFTAEREVNAMLDLVKQETERVDSTFLEPACGNGNFLAAILKRKLAVVDIIGKGKPGIWESESIKALMSLYGVDLLSDNVEECQLRLYGIWNEAYSKVCKKECSDQCRNTAMFILKRNILCGDALTLKDSEGKPIIFSEWSWIGNGRVKRRDFRLDVLMMENRDPNSYDDNNIQLSLFADEATGSENWMVDPLTGQSTPAPIAEYPLTHYTRLQEAGLYGA
ncbi:MAG: hypothetical protein MR021_00320 [Clostridiales bacterium]|nr:hypothetical protein [Clostridiales bacterium]